MRISLALALSVAFRTLAFCVAARLVAVVLGGALICPVTVGIIKHLRGPGVDSQGMNSAYESLVKTLQMLHKAVHVKPWPVSYPGFFCNCIQGQ